MNLNEIDEIKESNTAVMTKTKKSNQRKIGVPLIIAACIFLATILFFGVWKCFFDTSISGTWSFSIEKTTTNSETKKEEKEVVSYDFDFDNNGNFGMHRGGTTLKGRYEFVDYDGTPMLKISISNLGQPYITANFDYDVCGNIFTGRALRLTDRTGLLLPPDEESSDSKTDEQKAKMKIADSTVIDGYRYYIPEFKSSELTDKVEYYDDFKPDSKLTGSWLYKNGDSGYDYTYTFGDDGTFEMISSEIYTKGSYRIDDGKITVHYFDINGTEYETPLEYSVDGNKMTFGSMEVTKTASKDDYKQEIK